jgi:hypothetical protein
LIHEFCEYKAIVPKLDNQDTGFWMLEKGVARTARALALRVAFLLYKKNRQNTLLIQYQAFSIQHLGRLLVQRFCPNNMAQLQTK